MKILLPDFYQKPTFEVARALIGKIVVRKIDGQLLMGKIIETEAYGFDNDPASHAYRGRTKRNEPMFGQIATAYVYFIYGNHYCFNIVARDSMQAGAVLIRALEPIRGIEFMKKMRKKDNEILLTNGPGKLAQALQLNKNHNFLDLTKKGNLWIQDNDLLSSERIVQTKRIGINKAVDLQWRFCINNNQWVSRL